MAQYDVQDPAGDIHTIEGPDDATPEQVMQQAQALIPQPSKMESFGRAAVNNLPLGGQLGAIGTEALSDKAPTYSAGMDRWNKQAGWAKQANPISYGAGAVAGAAAPLAIPGVGEALEASPVAANAALGAANAVGNTDLSKAPKEALKEGLEGAGTGALLGKLMPSGEGMAAGLESAANKKGVQALNLQPGALGISQDELEDLGRFANEAGLVQGSTEEREAKARDLLEQVGHQIGEYGAGAAPLKDATPHIQNLLAKAAEYSKIDAPQFQNQAKIYKAGANALQGLSRPESVSEMSQLRMDEMGGALRNPTLPDLGTKPITYDELAQLKKTFGEQAFNANGDVINQASADVYGQIKKAMNSIIKDAPDGHQDAMTAYGMLKDIHAGLKNQLGAEQAKGTQTKGFGMVGKLAGMMGKHPVANVAAAAALAPAHPFMAAGALTPLLMNPQSMAEMGHMAANAAPAATHLTTQELNDFFASQMQDKKRGQ